MPCRAYNLVLSVQGVPLFVPQVVAQIVTDLKSLYDLGFRKFAVSKLEQTACLPSETAVLNYTTCNPAETPLATGHNTLLVANIIASLPKADVIFLDNESAFDFVVLFHFGESSNSSHSYLGQYSILKTEDQDGLKL